MMRYKIIANPAAGKGSAQKMIPLIEQRLRSYHLDFDLAFTKGPWHAAQLAQEAAETGYDVIVPAGGDGTCNEVLNGLMACRNSARPALGVICIGRGNDFAFGAGLPTGWEGGCRALAHGIRSAIDVGRVSSAPGAGACLNEGRYFGNGLGIGFDALVNVQASKTRLSGFLGYTVAALRTILLQFNAPLVEIICDQTRLTQPSLMISVMNGRRMGGGFLMTPESANNDAALDLCVAHKVIRATILMMIPRFMKGTQGGHPAVRFMKGKRVSVRSLDGPLPIHVDGETVCLDAHHLEIEVIPGAVNVLRLP